MVETAHSLGLYVFLDGVFGHHGGDVKPSPQGHLPVGPSEQVTFPESLPFYEEVALYWIDALEIDGWRLDQAYQVPLAAWGQIRAAVEKKCRERKAAGKSWGILGYMVAEVFDGEAAIKKHVFGNGENAVLPSAFDFSHALSPGSKPWRLRKVVRGLTLPAISWKGSNPTIFTLQTPVPTSCLAITIWSALGI